MYGNSKPAIKVFKGLNLMVYCPMSEWIRMGHFPEANFTPFLEKEKLVIEWTNTMFQKH